MTVNLSPDEILHYCNRLEGTIKFMANTIQSVMGLQLCPLTKEEHYQIQRMDPKEAMIAECFPMEYSSLQLIGINIVDGHIVVGPDLQSEISIIKEAIIGFSAIFSDGNSVTFLLEDNIPPNLTIERVYIHNRKAVRLEHIIKLAIRDSFILIEPLLKVKELPNFPPLWSRDPAHVMQISQDIYLNYCEAIDSVRRELIRGKAPSLKNIESEKIEQINKLKNKPNRGFSIDPMRAIVTVNGKEHPLTEEQWKVILAIQNANGERISGDKIRKMTGLHSEARVDQILIRIPDPVKQILMTQYIESKIGRGGGYRWKTP